MRVYLSGPMRGMPNDNAEAFNDAAQALCELAYQVENPHEHPKPPATTTSAFMAADLPLLLSCDMVAVLPGWQDSKGALIEVYVAFRSGIPVRNYDPDQRGLSTTLQKYEHPDISRGA